MTTVWLLIFIKRSDSYSMKRACNSIATNLLKLIHQCIIWPYNDVSVSLIMWSVKQGHEWRIGMHGSWEQQWRRFITCRLSHVSWRLHTGIDWKTIQPVLSRSYDLAICPYTLSKGWRLWRTETVAWNTWVTHTFDTKLTSSIENFHK